MDGGTSALRPGCGQVEVSLGEQSGLYRVMVGGDPTRSNLFFFFLDSLVLLLLTEIRGVTKILKSSFNSHNDVINKEQQNFLCA